MSNWSKPYVTVRDATGQPVARQLPDPLPFDPGASAHPDGLTVADLGPPAVSALEVRWRTPAHANPRKRRESTDDLWLVALAASLPRRRHRLVTRLARPAPARRRGRRIRRPQR
ncbi:hypothetical protein [Puerhibacterium puerhi]|uniref:hypothetical protein n=1 Tax=Puerhibacterium puerhi TaxID=2692623 RepID=UPI00135B2C12|nr:hypothetical protein [Puerhibacterium puerhi]